MDSAFQSLSFFRVKKNWKIRFSHVSTIPQVPNCVCGLAAYRHRALGEEPGFIFSTCSEHVAVDTPKVSLGAFFC